MPEQFDADRRAERAQSIAMIEVIPTWVPKDADDLARGAATIRAYATSIHVDVDDGKFAPHITWPYAPGVREAIDLSVLHGLSVEMHLMIEEPRDLGIEFARAGAKRIIAHIEGFSNMSGVRSTLDAWKEAGAKEVGLGLLWQTPFDVVEPFVAACDVVHLMTIASIGVQGIPYEPSAPARIAEFRDRFPATGISVDGGVNESNIEALARAGAMNFGVGSALSRAIDPKAAYGRLKALAENAIQ